MSLGRCLLLLLGNGVKLHGKYPGLRESQHFANGSGLLGTAIVLSCAHGQRSWFVIGQLRGANKGSDILSFRYNLVSCTIFGGGSKNIKEACPLFKHPSSSESFLI